MRSEYSSSMVPYSMFGNRKTNDRFISVLETLGQKFGQSIPRSAANKRDMEGIYHFFNSRRVMADYILLSERDRLMQYIFKECPSTILSIGDVTTLDYRDKRCAAKTNFVTSKNRPGYNVLSQLLCDGEGVPLGLFDQFYWNYKAEELGKRRQRQHLPVELKETGHYLRQWQCLNDTFGSCVQTRFVHLFDRAADVHELLQTQIHPHIFYIIRSKNNRTLSDKGVTISDLLDSLPPSGGYSYQINKQSPKKETFIEIKRQNSSKTESRKAKIEVTFTTAALRASNASSKRPLWPFQVGIVRAKEVEVPPGVEAIQWILYTTLPLNSFEDALEVIHLYTLRWQIENFHYTLKQGAKVEELQLENPKAILNAIATYSLLAVQVSRLRYLAEKQPATDLQIAGFTEQDYTVLAAYLHSKNNLEVELSPPVVTVEKFAQLISILGGNHNRKKVGVQSIWWGLQEFAIIKHTFLTFSSA